MIQEKELLAGLEERISYSFCNSRLLLQAITHSSYANERKINKIEDYERLEFLGDAVLELVSSEFLFRGNPSLPEGQLTKTRASMVCEPALAYCARQIGLEKYILLGKGEEITGGRSRDSIISDVMEAIIGAVYLDGGFEPARDLIHRVILSDVEDKQLFYDSKTVLQEMVQTMNHASLTYRLVAERGPEHDKEFEVEVCINDKVCGTGVGHNKKAAQQQAAYQAILELRKENK